MSIIHSCAGHVRQHCLDHFDITLKTSHAHEVVAAFFGYHSNIAQKAETTFPVSKIEEADVMIPDVERIQHRLTRLNNLPDPLPTADELAVVIADFLVEENWFGGQVILQSDLSEYVVDDYLHENISEIEEELSGAMADTNASFDEYPEYDAPVVTSNSDALIVAVGGTMSGSSDPDRPYSGHEINMTVVVTFYRVAGRTCFMSPQLEAGGSKNDGYFDQELPAAE